MVVQIDLGAGLSLAVPLSIGTLQWGTTLLDQYLVNPNGCIEENMAFEITDELRRHHVTLFDTAEGYGGGTSEKRLGRVASSSFSEAPQSDRPILMTKFLPAFWRYSHACFERALRASNRRLGIDCCPIYLLHSPVHWRPLEYWVEAAAICKRKGLLKALGLSNCNADEVRRAHRAGEKHGVPVIVNQVMYNLLDYKSAELREMESTCRELGVTIVAYSPIGQGLLTDGLTPQKYDPPSSTPPLRGYSLRSLQSCS
jgi:aryl-alcohol dehydrogenase-like predicted oxidoreductase